MSVKSLERKRDEILANAARVQADIDRAKGRKLIACNHCGKRSAVHRLTYIQTHFYVRPYSCTGGDYWSTGEGRFLCLGCGWENRLTYRPEVVKLKRHFARVVERYDDEEYPEGRPGAKRSTPNREWCN